MQPSASAGPGTERTSYMALTSRLGSTPFVGSQNTAMSPTAIRRNQSAAAEPGQQSAICWRSGTSLQSETTPSGVRRGQWTIFSTCNAVLAGSPAGALASALAENSAVLLPTLKTLPSRASVPCTISPLLGTPSAQPAPIWSVAPGSTVIAPSVMRTSTAPDSPPGGQVAVT